MSSTKYPADPSVNELTHIVHPFAPVVDPSCRILILGSLPSVRSRAEGFYYGHPRNRFWQVLAGCFSEREPRTVEEKTRLLLSHGIALWDVIASCDIHGSSDASVRNAVPVDIARITGKAQISRVLANGALAGKLYRQYLLPVTGIEAVVLPSTSPANAAWHTERLTEAWKPYLTE